MVRSCFLAAWRGTGQAGLIRAIGCMAVLALLSACAGHPQVNQAQEAARYEAHAARNYRAPGPPGDPWGPYVTEASSRFDVPTQWIREVMRVESGGLLYQNGELTTSNVGAMGLMQVMPETYDGLRDRYSLGGDPYDPHDNILAGAAYIREMYDLYGTPGFLAAYNAGPGRLDDYLTHQRPLPDETRHYVAKIGPYIAGIYPERHSPVEDLAMNQLPIDIPPGPRYGRQTSRAYAAAASHGSGWRPEPQPHVEARAATRPESRPEPRRNEVEVAQAELPRPPRMSPPPTYLALPPAEPQPQPQPRLQTVLAFGPSHNTGFHLIPPAVADTLPVHHGGPTGGSWAIQVGAYANEGQARTAAGAARGEARDAHPSVEPVHQAHAILYRARLTGMSRDEAVQACEKLGRGKGNCMVLSPASQS